MKILALDPATQCGWAYWDGTQLTSGSWDLSVRRDESADFRLIRLRKKLQELPDIELMIFEAAGFSPRKAAAQVAGQIEGVLLVWAHDCNIPFKSVKPTELKKFVTGKGKASKPQMIQAARDLTGRSGESDDEADARLVMTWAIAQYGTDEDKEAISRLRVSVEH